MSVIPRASGRFSSQSGQIGVIILLIMVVLLTVGLSLAARTTQELFVNQQTSESARVFNAAEAGIEQGLNSDLEALTFDSNNESPGSISTIDKTDVNYRIKRVFELETRLFEGVTVVADLPDDGTTDPQGVVIEWSKETDCSTQDPASLLAGIYNRDPGTGVTTVRYRALGGCDRSDGFELANQNGSSEPYHFRFTLALQPNDTFIRLKPVYNDTHIRVQGNNWQLPVQYYNIRSEAKNQEGNETRIVEVNRTLPTAPSVMDFALYSGTTIVK